MGRLSARIQHRSPWAKLKPINTPPVGSIITLPDPYAELRKQSLSRLLGNIDLTNYLHPENYKKWEKEIAEPAIVKSGWTVKMWWTVDQTRDGIVSVRGVVVVNGNGERKQFFCVPLPPPEPPTILQ